VLGFFLRQPCQPALLMFRRKRSRAVVRNFLEIDDQRVFRRLLNGEVGRIGALEDAVNVGCRLLGQDACVVPIGYQGASP
jgi:hypothetical protein